MKQPYLPLKFVNAFINGVIYHESFKYLTPALATLALVGCGDEPLTNNDSGGGTNPPPTPPPAGESLYIVHSNETVNATFDDWSNWGSGSQAETVSHGTYREIINITGGEGWGDIASSLAWGYLDQSTFDSSAYTHANFKVKSSSATTVEVSITSTTYGDDKQTYQLSTVGKPLADGWVQMQVPITTNSATTYFGLTFAGANAVSLADVYLSEEAGTTPPPLPDQDSFVLYDATSGFTNTDIAFSDDTIQEWSTGTVFNADDNFENKKAFSIQKGSKTPEEGNWGAVLVLQGGYERDLSEFNYIDVKVATKGGFDRYALSIASDGITKELQLPVDDQINDKWQTIRLPLSNFGLEMSKVNTVAIMGVGGQVGVSTFYVTDFQFVKTQAPEKDVDIAKDFVIIDATRDPSFGEANYGEWSTGSVFESNDSYLGKATWSITRGAKTPEEGNWGTVLALTHPDGDANTLADLSNHTNLSLQVAAVGKFDRYEVFLSANVNGKKAEFKIPFSLEDPEQWSTIDIDLTAFGLNLSHINQIAVVGVFSPDTTGQVLYLTDFHAYDSQTHPSRDHNDYGDRFLMISSTGEASDLLYDDSNFINVGNASFNDWSTGSGFDLEASYLGNQAWEITKGNGWGAVVAFTGDHYGAIMPFDFDMKLYKNFSFKLASIDTLNEFKIAFNTAKGASYEFVLTPQPNSDWTTYSFDMSAMPIDVQDIMQVAIFGANGVAGDKFYVTDMKFEK
ncbi:hypothetical protein D1115_15790 [Vibrio alfacsensis]|uniref:CBM11 domain-containing protein n=1 Tax=Vibrio alfacsensis TaxID=1074311 RepID=A0ABN5PH06_9VIBR|nr:hypothetical protein [Vibrio alfacsensis]AXY02522.1 hypothetical protein D1115_15790 [Vibrio alfacsensis]